MDEKKKKLIDEIVRREWEMFQNVNNEGGRASCQDDWPTFHVMREAQYAPWPQDLLSRFLLDLVNAKLEGRNLVMEKYAYMMEFTEPDFTLKNVTRLYLIVKVIRDESVSLRFADRDLHIRSLAAGLAGSAGDRVWTRDPASVLIDNECQELSRAEIREVIR